MEAEEPFDQVAFVASVAAWLGSLGFGIECGPDTSGYVTLRAQWWAGSYYVQRFRLRATLTEAQCCLWNDAGFYFTWTSVQSLAQVQFLITQNRWCQEERQWLLARVLPPVVPGVPDDEPPPNRNRWRRP